MHEFRTQRKIEFVDTDMEGIVHFSRYLVFMETAEHEFLEAIGSSVALKLDGRRIGWPRVKVGCEYQRPARFGDVLAIHVEVLRKGTRSMTYAIRFERDGEPIARGEATSVCCQLEPGPMHSIEIPRSIADRIEEAPR